VGKKKKGKQKGGDDEDGVYHGGGRSAGRRKTPFCEVMDTKKTGTNREKSSINVENGRGGENRGDLHCV